MAPAPPISPQKRVTRARAAAKKAGDDLNKSKPSTGRKPTALKAAEAIEEQPVESDMATVNEPLRKSARRVAPSAPARRIKVTPLDRMTTPSIRSRKPTAPHKSLPSVE